MGRALQNTMINLGIQGACDEAMYQASDAICVKRKTKKNTKIEFILFTRDRSKNFVY